MGADERIDEFENWSRGRGLVARDVDRKRIVRELFEIAGPGAISTGHIEALVKRYREGLVGAHKVLLARRVGEEVLSWQDESASETGAQAVGEEADLSEGLRDLMGERPRSRPPSARPEKLSSRPPNPISARPPERGSARPLDRTSARPPPKPDAGELGFDEFPEPPPIPGRMGLDTSEPRQRARANDDSRRPGKKEASDPPEMRSEWSDPPREGSVRPRESARPERERSVKPPLDLAGDEFALDDEPKRFVTGRSKPPSARPPPGASSLPDVEADDRGVDPERRRRHEDLTDSIAPPPIATPPAYPLGDVTTTERKFSIDDYVSSKLLIGVGGALFIVLVMTTLIVRPSFLFGDHHAPVKGTFVAKDLGATIDFRDEWYHAEDLDGEEAKGPWTRRVAQFYRGGSDFHSAPARVTFVVFDSDKAIATDDDARQLGANETLNMAQRRKCEPFEYEGKKGTQCFAMTSQLTRPFGLVETYYADSGKVVFSRALIEMPNLGIVAGDPLQQAQSQENFERDLVSAYVEIEKVVFSLKIQQGR